MSKRSDAFERKCSREGSYDSRRKLAVTDYSVLGGRWQTADAASSVAAEIIGCDIEAGGRESVLRRIAKDSDQSGITEQQVSRTHQDRDTSNTRVGTVNRHIRASGALQTRQRGIKAMDDRTSIASWNLVADGLDCGFKISNAVADTINDELEWTRDLLAVRSAYDLIGVWIQHSSKQALKNFAQLQTLTEVQRRLFNDYVTMWRAVGLLPPDVTLPVSTQKADALSPEREVLLLHIME